ncbi:hypothetical protein DL89DRAFT_290312 [Linderina pennispora]|uniref:Uncharacterized protein n=1 Tax=Linderina pennispora TaxID=61395 RepID=A0A1Y1WMU8_9FUNG|nr:uncharacterized protein DL89DRAFT_290312 [Linderina pennispora]ORX74843.1 hypothetical protein DL89DRAFT_290312 [Linderina pennispora]
MYTAVHQQFQQHQHYYEYQRLDSASASSESDDIDDILSSLWPTTRDEAARAPLALAAHGISSKAVHGGMAQWNSGQCTPPDDHSGTREFPGHAAGNYSVYTPVSCSIQIGDPEWRVDSPPAVPPGLVPTVEPISPPTYCGYAAEPVVQQIYEGRASLGLGNGQPANRSASSLGLFRNSRTHMQQRSAASRVLTPEERSRETSVQNADLKRHLQASTMKQQQQQQQQQHKPDEARKPTFADDQRRRQIYQQRHAYGSSSSNNHDSTEEQQHDEERLLRGPFGIQPRRPASSSEQWTGATVRDMSSLGSQFGGPGRNARGGCASGGCCG